MKRNYGERAACAKCDQDIEMTPNTDWWMRGARYGTIVRILRTGIALVKLDKVRRAVRVHPSNLTLVEKMKRNPHKRSSRKPLSKKQAAWRKKFAAMVRAGKFRKTRRNPSRKSLRKLTHKAIRFAGRDPIKRASYRAAAHRITAEHRARKLRRNSAAPRTTSRGSGARAAFGPFNCRIMAQFGSKWGYFTGTSFDTDRNKAVTMSKKTALEKARELARQMNRTMRVEG